MLGECRNHSIISLAVNCFFAHINNEAGLALVNHKWALAASGLDPNDKSLGCHG